MYNKAHPGPKRKIMNNTPTLKKGSSVSPEKYQNCLRVAAALARQATISIDKAVYDMDDRLFTGYEKHSDQSRQNLTKAIEQTRKSLEILQQLWDINIDYELYD